MLGLSHKPQHVAIENEIVEKLRAMGRPVWPRELRLTTTNSKVNKCHAIQRLIRRGVVREIVTAKGSRRISLQAKEYPNTKNKGTKQ